MFEAVTYDRYVYSLKRNSTTDSLKFCLNTDIMSKKQFFSVIGEISQIKPHLSQVDIYEFGGLTNNPRLNGSWHKDQLLSECLQLEADLMPEHKSCASETESKSEEIPYF